MRTHRIVIHTGDVPPGRMSFGRYNRNPLIMQDHLWHKPPIGIMSQMRMNKRGKLTGKPLIRDRVFNRLHRKHFLHATIGGVWNDDKTVFTLYEVSLSTTPYNAATSTK